MENGDRKMKNEPLGDYYDYKKTMQPERPWLVDWHQRFVYRHTNALRSGTGMYSGDPEMAAARSKILPTNRNPIILSLLTAIPQTISTDARRHPVYGRDHYFIDARQPSRLL
jgi:hypothetical protein